MLNLSEEQQKALMETVNKLSRFAQNVTELRAKRN